jgi:Site-specific recombinase XerD
MRLGEAPCGADLEIRLRETKGDKPRDVPILSSLANELRLHIGDRETGWLFRSRQGGHYSTRRVQQIVKSVASGAGIQKRVYPHLLRHTVAQRLADEGMREELLHQFLGHRAPQTTQRYYEPKRRHVEDAFKEAMGP